MYKNNIQTHKTTRTGINVCCVPLDNKTIRLTRSYLLDAKFIFYSYKVHMKCYLQGKHF